MNSVLEIRVDIQLQMVNIKAYLHSVVQYSTIDAFKLLLWHVIQYLVAICIFNVQSWSAGVPLSAFPNRQEVNLTCYRIPA